MRIYRLLAVFTSFAAQAQGTSWDFKQPPQTEEEALFLRRIADFWQEGDYLLAKKQMEEFLTQFPQSPYADPLCAALGDLFLREKNYSTALQYYVKVTQEGLLDTIFLSRMQCLYQMQWYATLAEECENYLQQKRQISSQQQLQVTYYLAISLYQQCLNASKDPTQLQKWIARAIPCFETLSQSELSVEVAEGFAHLCCLAKDFPKAANLYLQLAEQNPALQEERLFQAALIQAEYDKPLALNTFETIAQMGQKRAKEAAYNRFVLAHELGRHEELVASKETLLRELPPEKEPLIHLFLGKSLSQIKQYESAIEELLLFLESDPEPTSLRGALLVLWEASFETQNLTTLETAITALNALDPEDPLLPRMLFAKVQLLKKGQKTEEARKELAQLLERYPQSDQQIQALFERTHLDHQVKDWVSCSRQAQLFLSQFPEHAFAIYVRRYLASASLALASEQPDQASLQERAIQDIESLLTHQEQLAASEVSDWRFLLAKATFERGHLDSAISALEKLTQEPTDFPQKANAKLLLALAYREKKQDPALFCQLAQAALDEGASLLNQGQMHLTLFNAYLEIQDLEKAADHLFFAFAEKVPLQEKNLQWLTDYSFQKISQEKEQNPHFHSPRMAQTASVLEALLHTSSTEPLEKEQPLLCLAQLYHWLNRPQDAIALLEFLSASYTEAPLEKRTKEAEVKLLLAQSYLQNQDAAKAMPLFSWVIQNTTQARSFAATLARLETTRWQMRQESVDPLQIATQLKDLVLQRTLANEPLHLEAALDYIEWKAAEAPLEKKWALVQKTLTDFQSEEDLLSKDYQQSRAKLPLKNKIYEGYMQLLEAKSLLIQAKLHQESDENAKWRQKAQELLSQILQENTHPDLVARAHQEWIQGQTP